MVKAMVPLADGFEDIEAFTIIDVLRRAGVTVDIVGLSSNIVTSAHNVRVHADSRLVDLDSITHDALVIPGGPGYKNLLNSDRFKQITELMVEHKKVIGAICAAPVVLSKFGLLKGVKATAYPGYEKEFDMPRNDRVVVDGNFITSQGPGTAIEFSLKLVEKLVGAQKASALKKDLLA